MPIHDFGLIIVNKPVGPTSHRVVSVVRQGTGIRKVGHAGTLDPRASGVLVLCLGAATRLSEFLSTDSKRYEAVVRFGSSTETFDSEGDRVRITGAAPRIEDIRDVLQEFRGEIEQVPPPYSAIKIQGKKAYELARKGEEVELEPRTVTIYDLVLVEYRPPDLVIEIECSAGTYIRSLANDLGERLTTGAHLASLRRTKAGVFTLEDSVALPALEVALAAGNWDMYRRPAADALPDLPKLKLLGQELDDILNGRRIASRGTASGMVRAIGPDGDLIALLEATPEGDLWHPKKVFTR
ncbi:MAG: tRNA pseudouridine(55) synthase TruB [Anaerolineales bacterium]|jgi:tRNA pseudouridine55 synthase